MIAKLSGRGRPGGPVRALLLVALLSPAVAHAAQAPLPAPEREEPWPAHVEAALRSFFERVDVEEVVEGLVPPRADDERLRLESFAAGLDRDIPGPWAAIRHGFELVPYVGSVRGAEGTLATRGGNSLDRALLLARLYRGAGRRVRLVRGHLAWEPAARLLKVPARDAGRDPWLRWMETVADHWWLEVRDGDTWLPVDPTAADRPGETPGHSGSPTETVPEKLTAVAELALARGQEELLAVRLPVVDLLGSGVEVGAERRLPSGSPAGEGGEEVRRSADEQAAEVRPQAGEGRSGDPGEEGAAIDERDPVISRLPRIDPGPVVLTLQAGGDARSTRPLARPELSQVSLRIRVRLPTSGDLRLEIPFGSQPDTRIAVVLGAGPVPPARLSRAVVPLWRTLRDLADVEASTHVAFRERPRPDDEEPRPDRRARLTEEPPSPTGSEEAEELLHPAEELHLQTALAWLEFDRRAPGALALALLAGSDRLQARGAIARTGVRLAAVHWQPPAVESEGRFTVWVRDPVVVTGAPERIPRLQAANGLLQAAMWGQVLNGIAAAAPVTAFDVTLRSVGTGRRLSWWQPGQGSAPDWPEEVGLQVRTALASGYLVAGPSEPVLEDGRRLLGWWQVPPRLGLARGWVRSPGGPAQATVPFGEARSLDSLDALLASVPELHGALRWLVRVADPDSGVLAALRVGICAAASLVGDLMDAGAPPGWPGADFATFCAGPPRP